MLSVKAQKGDIAAWKGDAIVVNIFGGVARPAGATGAVDAAMDGAISELVGSGDLKGKAGETCVLYAGGKVGAGRVVVVGLGTKAQFDLDGVRRAAGASIRALKGTRTRTAATIVHGAGVGGLDAERAARALTEAALSASFKFERKGTARKQKDEKEKEEDETLLESLAVLEADATRIGAVRRGVARGVVVGECQTFARTIASISGGEATPTAVATLVTGRARDAGLSCKVLTPKDIQAQRMGGLLAVSQGSAEPPRFVVLEWKPRRYKRTVCIVGKGVTFDTGGISIKSAENMDKMRYDKSGAAATYGVLLAAARLKLPVRVIGLTPLAENMPSGTAIKPGDVVTMRSGLNVDVLNTDAEGRLILADALDYAKEFKPDLTVDMATLTGACSVAVGTQCIAAMGNDDRLMAALRKAGDESHERVWPLPFFEEYAKQIKGVVGDIKNVGGRNAGTITAGKFLERFAPEKGWVHLDIASTAWNEDKPMFNEDYYPAGATGVGVRLLATWLENLS